MPALEEIVFEEPKFTKRPLKYERLLIELKEKPDTWAKIGEFKTDNSAYQAARNLKSGKYRIPEGEFEFTSSEKAVYARYLNGKS